MRNRRGFTLVELLIALVMMLMVGATLFRMLTTMQRVSRSQAEQVQLQANVRSGALAVLSELREIGFDTNTTTSAITSDLLGMGLDWVQFRAMRGIGTTCGTPSILAGTSELRLSRPFFGNREPVLTDGFLLFLENDPNLANDDMWVPLTVTNIDYASTCGGASAISLTFTTPDFSPGVEIVATQVIVGGPVRTFEQIQFGIFAQGGKSWLGIRNLSTAEPGYSPVVGPLQSASGFRLNYFDSSNGAVPLVGNPATVRSIEVSFNGLTDAPIALAGQSVSNTKAWNLVTRVALRNTLRP